MKLICFLLFPLLLFSKDITISVNAISGVEQAKKEWQPTMDYLQKALPQHQFHLLSIEPHNIAAHKKYISEGRVDFVITQPAIYIELELELGVSRILTIIKQQGLAEFGSLFITQKTSDINVIEDIKGETISAVAPLGFGGWLIAYNELRQKGVDPLKDDLVTFEGTQVKVVDAILQDKSSVGVIRTGIYERLKQQNVKGIETLRVIHPQQIKGFPYLLSSRLYPEWALAKTQKVSNKIAKEVASAFLTITADSRAAKSASYESWTFPYNYQPVHELMKDLGIGVYADYGKMSLEEIVYEYKYLIMTFILLFILLVAFLMYSRKMNKRLYAEREVRQQLLSQFETIFDLQVSLLLVIQKGCIIKVNHAFLDFFDVITLPDFLEQGCVFEKSFDFVDDDNYISVEKHGQSWIQLLLDHANEETPYKVKIGRTIFAINLKELPIEEDSYIVMLRDITYIEDNQAFLESQIEVAKKEITEKQKALHAQAKLASMGEMIAVIAHQLKQPLSTMSVISNTILLELFEDAVNKSTLEDEVNKILRSVDMMTETIDDFRAFFAPNKRMKPFSLDRCIESVLTLLNPILQKDKITIVHDKNSDVELLSVESELFHVIMNIINNAKDELISRGIEDPSIHISSFANGDKVILTIEDNAGGIDAAIMDKIFDQYFTTKDDSGTGIGLHLAKMIVQDSLGGSLVVDNGPIGARFIISL